MIQNLTYIHTSNNSMTYNKKNKSFYQTRLWWLKTTVEIGLFNSTKESLCYVSSIENLDSNNLAFHYHCIIAAKYNSQPKDSLGTYQE